LAKVLLDGIGIALVFGDPKIERPMKGEVL
jgi:hypothetical protein